MWEIVVTDLDPVTGKNRKRWFAGWVRDCPYESRLNLVKTHGHPNIKKWARKAYADAFVERYKNHFSEMVVVEVVERTVKIQNTKSRKARGMV